ncbi:MAG: SMC-Scp complex subunit ScpB [Candidatus Woesearchaeota archaeon]
MESNKSDDLKSKLEALLFASGRKMELDELARLVKIRDRAIIKEKLMELKEEYEKRKSPVILIEEGDKWKLTVHENQIQLVRQINTHTELSKTMIETLAVIAWKQPMLQSDVIKIRTNKAYDHIKELMDMGFVVKERYGRTYLLKLTQKFFEYFDLRNDESLKAMFKDIKIDVVDQKKMGDFKEEENKQNDETEKGDGLQEKKVSENMHDQYQYISETDDDENNDKDDELEEEKAGIINYEKI